MGVKIIVKVSSIDIGGEFNSCIPQGVLLPFSDTFERENGSVWRLGAFAIV